MLYLRNFAKKYGNRCVVTAESIDFGPGVYWIRGANGAGKTTLFKALAGLIPCNGIASFEDGISLHSHPVEYRRRVSFSEAEPIYPEFLTGGEIFRFAARARRITPAQQTELAERFGTDVFHNQTCGTYSSGMTKRLSLAIAFLGTPQLIILDEPFITLDQSIRDTLTDLISELIPRRRVTMLISSHETLPAGQIPVVASFTIAGNILQMA